MTLYQLYSEGNSNITDADCAFFDFFEMENHDHAMSYNEDAVRWRRVRKRYMASIGMEENANLT